MTPAILCRNITHDYGRKRALEDVSWSLQPGRICGLLGRNGAGKTTTINILNSFLTPSSGECLLLGEASDHLSTDTKSRIGYLIEGHVQYDFLDCRQIERFYSRFYPRWAPAIYHHLISKLDIVPRQRISTMSCGQRSQVALGLILAQQPDLIILDDYSLGLDPGYRRLFIEVLRDYAADGRRSILLTSHIIQDLEGLVDDVIIYRRGRVLLDCPASRLREDFARYSFETPSDFSHLDTGTLEGDPQAQFEYGSKRSFLTGFLGEQQARAVLSSRGLQPGPDFRREKCSLEDAFISLTGKY